MKPKYLFYIMLGAHVEVFSGNGGADGTVSCRRVLATRDIALGEGKVLREGSGGRGPIELQGGMRGESRKTQRL